MIYEKVYDNLLYTISTVRSVTKEQLYHFFRNECPKAQIERYLRSLETHHIIKIFPNGVVESYNGVPLRKEEKQRRRKAFWVLASIGSNNIREFSIRGGYIQFIFITNNNEVCDVALVEEKVYIPLIKQEWQRSIVRTNDTDMEGEEDLVYHIAFTAKNADLEFLALDENGFDSRCYLGEGNKVVYEEFS